MRIRDHMSASRQNSAGDVEKEVVEVTQLILDIVTKHPQRPHIADDMEKAGMHEHRREDRRELNEITVR